MYSDENQLQRLFLIMAAISLLLNLQGPTWARSVESRRATNKTAPAAEKITKPESPPDRPENKFPAAPNKIDKFGEKVGNQVDDFTRKPSSRAGSWIGKEAFYGIT